MAPLAGIKVVELGVMIAVPAASETLAGFGASVIKIEDAKRGDDLRSFGSNKNGISGWFANANAGKRSLAVDLNTDAGKAILWKLLAEADVLIQGFRAGVLTRLGFSPDEIAERCPQLVYCSSTGFGENGPYADQPAYDPVIQALSGWASSQLVDGKPTLHKSMVSDKTAAVYNTQAILAALVQRARTGQGCYIEASMLDSNIMYNWPDVMMHCTVLDEDATHLPNLLATYRLYECTDGYVTIACGTDKQWQSYCAALDQPSVAEDPDLLTPKDRAANMDKFYSCINDLSSQFSVEDVVQRLRKADVPVAPVHNPEEVRHDPQVAARGLVKESAHPVLGKFLHTKQPASMFGVDLSLSPAPMHGEQSREILEELGYADADIKLMSDEGVIICR